MQNLFHDGGFSSVGMSLRAMATYEKGLDEYMDEKMAKVSIELDGVAISCANRGAVSALPSKIADTNCFFSQRFP